MLPHNLSCLKQTKKQNKPNTVIINTYYYPPGAVRGVCLPAQVKGAMKLLREALVLRTNGDKHPTLNHYNSSCFLQPIFQCSRKIPLNIMSRLRILFH